MTSLTALSFQNLDGMEGRITSVGHGFAQGDIAPGETLTGTVGGVSVPVQMDVLATWPDGSVKHAIVSFETSAGLGETSTLDLQAVSQVQGPQTDIAALAAAQEYEFSVTIDGETVDVAALVQQGPVDLWQSGDLVTQGRVTHTLANGVELRADVTVRADGTIDTSITIGNDNVETTSLDALTYAVAIVQGGETVFENPALTQYHFTVWRESFSTETAANTVHAVYDMEYLRGTGLLPAVDTGLTLEDGDQYGEYLDDPNATYDPMELGGVGNDGGIDEDRGRSGATKSYGVVTDDQHSYLVTQTAKAREGMLALTDQYGAFSDFYRNPETGEAYLLEDTDFNSFYTGLRKDIGGTGGVVDLTNDGLALRNKQSHDPSAFYTAYLVTGDRFYADGLASEGASAHLLWKNAAVLTADGAVDFGEQLRAQAWGLRDLFYAATLAPDGSHSKPILEARLEAALQEYYDYYIGGETLQNQLGRDLTGSREAAAFSEGPLSGVLQSYNGTALDRPYWQDWFGTVIGQIAMTGNETAKALGAWMANFSAGRFLQDDFDATNSLYSLTNGSRDMTGAVTWAELQAIAEGNGRTATDDWAVDGFYTASAWGGNASLFSGTRDARFAEALLWMTGELSQQAEDVVVGNGQTVQLAAPVQFLDNSIAGITDRTVGTDAADTLTDGDGNRFIAAGAGDDTVTTGEGNHLVDGGDGNDTLIGGSGEDWLFGGSGEDRLSGGEGVNFLQGDRYDADFGRFADTFVFEDTLGETEVLDFTAGQDRLEFTDLAGLNSADDVLAAFLDTDAGALLDLGEAGRLLLRGVTVAALQAKGLVVAGPETVAEGVATELPLPLTTNTITAMGWLQGTDQNDHITPLSNNVRVFGRGGDDLITLGGSSTVAKGGAGNDSIVFEGARHLAWGDAGADAFIVTTGSTRIDIMDFDVAEDALYFTNGAGRMDSLDDIEAAMSMAGGHTVIQMATGTVTLRNVDMAELGAGTLYTYTPPADVEGDIKEEGGLSPSTVDDDWFSGTHERDPIFSERGNMRLDGSYEDDHIVAEHWAVRMQGGAGNDLLESRAHDAILRGDAGSDIFLFRGRVDGRVQDFNKVEDRLAFDIDGTGLADFAQLLAMMEDGETGVDIVSDNGDRLTLEGVMRDDLAEDMFLFV